MITIVEPKEHLKRLWGKQRIREDDTYRMMRYVLRMEYEGKVLLQNAVTYQLVVLNDEEVRAIDSLPGKMQACLVPLIEEHYIVPQQFDEHQQVIKLRYILSKFESTNSSNAITKYTILPTTACNARCYYCFEHGTETCTMSEQTTQDVVDFISNNCGSERIIHITWFGGEPTVAANRIDQISRGLRENGIDFSSEMITNGYLFDTEMVHKAKAQWNLKYLQICFDGPEIHHNAIKDFVNARENAYQRTLRNIGLLLNEGIRVGMRMNFDLANHDDFYELLEEAKVRFKGNPDLSVYAFPIIGEYPDKEGKVLHGDTDWFIEEIRNLNEASRAIGLYHERQVLPYLQNHCCDAENDAAIVILPSGKLVRCCECLSDENCVGTIWTGITEKDLYSSWKQYADYEKCANCSYFPKCLRIARCPGHDRCQFIADWNSRNEKAIKEAYSRFRDLQEKKGDYTDDV